MDSPQEPLNDSDFDRFLQEVVEENTAEKRAKKERQAYAAQSAQESIDATMKHTGYEPLVPGTARYDSEVQRITPFIELDVLAEEDAEGTPEEVDAIIARTVANNITTSNHTESRIIETIKNMLGDDILENLEGAKPKTLDEQNHTKRRVIAVLFSKSFAPDSPIIRFVNAVLPGDIVDVYSAAMREYYEPRLGIHQAERQQTRDQTTAVLQRLVDMMRPQEKITEEELDQHLAMLYDLTDDAIETFKNGDLSDKGKLSRLTILVKMSPLGETRAQQVVDYVKENIAFL